MTSNKPESQSETELIIKLGGDEFVYQTNKQQSILETALQNGLDVPYSCMEGVCQVCSARVVEGETTRPYPEDLGPEEPDAVLTCQSCPQSRRVIVDYDNF